MAQISLGSRSPLEVAESDRLAASGPKQFSSWGSGWMPCPLLTLPCPTAAKKCRPEGVQTVEGASGQPNALRPRVLES